MFLSKSKFASVNFPQLLKLAETYNSALFNNYNRYSPYAFWKPTKEKQWYKINIVGGKGDIAEAYAYFYYNIRDNGENFHFAVQHLYDNLDTFFRQGVAKVDSISGLYTSDVITNSYGYAVKSLDASLSGYMQMFRLVRDILNGKINTIKQLTDKADTIVNKKTEEQIQKGIQKGIRNKISRATNEELKEFLK